MNKRIILAVCSVFIFGAAVYSQQITRFAVVNFTAIFDTFRKDSKAARDYQNKQAKYKEQMQELQDEIISLRQKKVDAAALGKDSVVKKFEEQIAAKTAFLQEFVKAGNDELEFLKRKLVTDDDFYSSLYKVIQRLAEAEGYSMVLSLQQGSGIIWYSPTVDITDKVIQELKK